MLERLIYEDRTRYLKGFECRWKRLLGFHFADVGISPPTASDEINVGIQTHGILERLLSDEKSTVTRMIQEQPLVQGADPYITSCVNGMSLAYERITLPWVRENFDVISVEQEESINIPVKEGPPRIIKFQARPDFILRRKADDALVVGDFKTKGYWSDDSAIEWQQAIQMMVNAYLASLRLGEPIKEYYVHVLVRGKPKYPTAITHPWAVNSVSPIGKPFLSARYKRGYARTPIWETGVPLSEWIAEMPEEELSKYVPVVGPFRVDEEAAKDFLSGVATEAVWWDDRVRTIDWRKFADPAVHAELISRFPRTYNCWEYGRSCEFSPICFRAPGYGTPASIGFVRRVPHHPEGDD